MEAKKLDNFLALASFTKAEVEFIIGERRFKMKPLVPKKLRLLIQMLEFSGNEIENIKNFNASVEYALKKMIDLFPIIFGETVTQDFIDENMSIPLCLELWEQFVKLNRIEGIIPFFRDAIRVKAALSAKEATSL
jgi:hypothetical protein